MTNHNRLFIVSLAFLMIACSDNKGSDSNTKPNEEEKTKTTTTSTTGNVSSCPAECKPNETCLNGVCTPFSTQVPPKLDDNDADKGIEPDCNDPAVRASDPELCGDEGGGNDNEGRQPSEPRTIGSGVNILPPNWASQTAIGGLSQSQFNNIASAIGGTGGGAVPPAGGAGGGAGGGGAGQGAGGEETCDPTLQSADLRFTVDADDLDHVISQDPAQGLIGTPPLKVKFYAYHNGNQLGADNSLHYEWSVNNSVFVNPVDTQYETTFSRQGIYVIQVKVTDACGTFKYGVKEVRIREPQAAENSGGGNTPPPSNSGDNNNNVIDFGGPAEEFAAAMKGSVAVVVKIHNSQIAYRIYQLFNNSFRDDWVTLSRLQDHLPSCPSGETRKLASPSVAMTPDGARIIIAAEKQCIKDNRIESTNVVHQEVRFQNGDFRERYDSNDGVVMGQSGSKWSPKVICLDSGDCVIGYIRYRDEGRLPEWEDNSLWTSRPPAVPRYRHLVTKKVYYKVFPGNGPSRGPFRVNENQDAIPGEWGQGMIARDIEGQLTATSCGDTLCFSFMRSRRDMNDRLVSRSEWFIRMGMGGDRYFSDIERQSDKAPDSLFELKYPNGTVNLIKVYKWRASTNGVPDGQLTIKKVDPNNRNVLEPYDMVGTNDWLSRDRFFFNHGTILYSLQETEGFDVSLSTFGWRNTGTGEDAILASFDTNSRNVLFSHPSGDSHYLIVWYGVDNRLHGVIGNLP